MRPDEIMFIMQPLRGFGKSWVGEFKLIREIWRGGYPDPTNKFPVSILERFFMSLFVFLRSLSLIRIKDLFPERSIHSEISEFYVVGWLILLVTFLAWQWLPTTVIIGLTAYRIVDGFNYRLCIVFVDRYARDWGLRSVNRSLLILMLNYCELIVGFAILYLMTGTIWSGEKHASVLASPRQALYFSLVTITTLGYGDFAPGKALGEWLVIFETFMGFTFVVIVVATIISGIQGVRELPPRADPHNKANSADAKGHAAD